MRLQLSACMCNVVGEQKAAMDTGESMGQERGVGEGGGVGKVVEEPWVPASVGVVAVAGAPGRWSEGQAQSAVGQL